ncbi:NAD(P)-dependent alcohol dehydrogenase [Culicoidibacter larvae]|uniref:NAD(P)-dependent alcohol dehydrogenase n=1 Tax=Culicoidibacter larvae TaxID=2579976 RepID=A0A5R8Q9U5_9FIRM|nr:NAD(P)-dependent alcohol dehydrogenase [Culicoidibacter larvae]TLG71742.1 NAD(P)-dependent alcohol dehydrogenase [Culicoidibacter larvae]
MKTEMMKVAACTAYNDISAIKFLEQPIPIPKPNEVLVKVSATTVSAGDKSIFSLTQPFMKIIFGLKKLRQPILGSEFSGTVVQVGDAVTDFSPGDKVFGSSDIKFKAHAEYKCINEKKAIAIAPNNLDINSAAALAFGGCTAHTFLNKANIKSCSNVLIYGASGAVGTAAVQLAKAYGAKVTAIASTNNLGLLKELGADQTIDYTLTDYKNLLGQYDIIFDAVGKMDKTILKNALQPDGRFVSVAKGLSSETKIALNFIKKLVEVGKYKPVIDSTYDFDNIQEAFKRTITNKKVGNVLVIVNKSDS